MLSDIKYTSALDYASGNTDRNGAIIDMAGYEGVMMFVKFAAIATGAVTSVHAEQGANSALSDAQDLEGTYIAVAADDDNQTFIIDLKHPTDRYVRVVVDKDTSNNTAEMAWYIQYGADNKPITNTVANAVTSEYHYVPSLGEGDIS